VEGEFKMSEPRSGIEKRLQIAGALIILGLIVEIVSLNWKHPGAFISFIIGAFFMVIGILYYLISLITTSRAQSESPN
jgi:hypothetical protein